MPHPVLQSSTSGFYIFADDAGAYGEGLSGLSISVSLSKGGGAFNAVSPTITDLGDGVYWVAPLAAHRDTLGEIAWKFAATGAIIASRFERVVVVNDQIAQWGVPAAVLAAAAATPIRADMRLINGEPPQPLGYEPAKQETLLEVQAAVEALASSAGTGDRKITARVTLNGDGEIGVSGVRVSIAGTTLVAHTDIFGFVEFNVAGGDSYTLRFTPPAGYQAIADVTVEVSDTDPPLEEIAAFPATPSVGPEGTCVLTFRVASQSDGSKEGIIGSAKLVDGHAVINNTVNLNFVEEAPSDVNGNIVLTLCPDQQYDLSVKRPGHTAAKIRIRTPNSPTATLPQVIEV